MNMPLWTDFSDDPNNRDAKAAVRNWLPSARRIHDDIDLLGFIRELVRGQRVLDIGVVSHSARYFDQPDWRHGQIAAEAKYCLGLDILEDLVGELNARGFNVRCVDATSDADLGDRFDVIFIGDVVEHVNNPVDLLAFAGRHLTPEGKLYATTPNPFSRKFFREFRRSKGNLVVNLDHVAWITPTLAMELARRSGLRLNAYHLVKRLSPFSRLIKSLTWQIEPPEYSFPDYIYEFSRPR
ncbi:class I SAM-dependent methyltransferase [Propionivibrio dicarboxylicus]|uniref:Methyltransferase domain-containing protein n=1 Tax=Propionivibrio dicarboxylicus TaxID=83767 RepID=A0A1G8KZZ3_9RHOO|nr:methyltransferase domain-containing protein [Propionivibrio dicarboxylicus]SDI49028.1 Methyltransferase domain-containing protein [Propionivibrio dicarboxylicus]